MQYYRLNRVANQRISIMVEQNSYEFRFRTYNDMLFVDVSVNGEAVANSVRCCPYGLIIPYKHMEGKGNFFFVTSDEKYPSYKDFDGGCQFCYIDNAELSAMRTKWQKLHG